MLLMMGGIVARNMLIKAIAKNKTQLLHLVGLISTIVTVLLTVSINSTGFGQLFAHIQER